MVEVNGMEPRPVRVIDEYSFTIENTSKYGKYQGGGFVNYEKVPFTMRFKSFEENLKNPKLANIPPSKLSQMEMHAALVLYFDWAAEIEENPRILAGKSDEDLENIALEIFMSNSAVSYLYEEHELDIGKITGLLVNLIKFEDFQFTPVASFVANIAAFQ
jgi:ubiquitin-activating enzyme E1